ncbi:hypothetical protein BGZ97_013153 [Linnemannia gamsii]|uniref:PWI domain-containing protein n=1 Tax=Linnemannia gamsii TaxID=64522 RepID=A0A9P6RLT1_9FUNG|nr:hypothetical protein BGZ97_013153 [Linnemannia gamsii]
MGDAGFFKGTSAGQDTRFSDKHKKMLKSMNFPPEFNQKVDMKKVNMKVIKDWMAERVIQLLGIEDEVVVEYAVGMLEEPSPDPKSMQINLQGFLDKNTQLFVLELWKLLISAQTSLGGIPQQFLDITKAEILKAKQAKEGALARIREQEEKERAIAAELRQKAQAIREASRPKALDIAKEPAVTRRDPDIKPTPVQDDRKAHEERRNRESQDRDRSRDRNGRRSGDLGVDSSKRRRIRSESRSRSRSRSRTIRKDTRSRSRTPPSATTSSAAGNVESQAAAPVETSAAAAAPVDPKILENQLREKLLRERVLQSVKNKRASTDAGSSEEKA